MPRTKNPSAILFDATNRFAVIAEFISFYMMIGFSLLILAGAVMSYTKWSQVFSVIVLASAFANVLLSMWYLKAGLSSAQSKLDALKMLFGISPFVKGIRQRSMQPIVKISVFIMMFLSGIFMIINYRLEYIPVNMKFELVAVGVSSMVFAARPFIMSVLLRYHEPDVGSSQSKALSAEEVEDMSSEEIDHVLDS